MTGDEQIVQLDPTDILADDNSRFSLKAQRTDALAANILTTGGVLSPVEVEAIEGAKKAPHYRLTAGFYRHAAVGLLNTRDKAGLTLPAIVRAPADALERLTHQITENVEREDMSPMDTAVAIKRLIDAGVSKPDVRKTFARPGVNRNVKKGGTAQPQPMSNAMLNIYLAFLALPKAIQGKIHDGSVGVAAAYELGKVPAEKRQAVIDRAEADRAAELAREEKDEERYLASQKKAEESKSKAADAAAAVEAAKDEIVAAEKKVAEKTQDLRTVQAQNYDPSDTAAKSAYMEKLKGAENDLKAAQKLGKDSKNKLAKAIEAKHKAEALAVEKAAEAAGDAVKGREGKAGKGKGAAIGPKEVQKAAAKEGAAGTGYTPLTLSEIRDAVKEVAAGKVGADDRTAAIAKEFKACFDGIHTPKMLAETINQLLDKMGAVLPQKAETPAKK